MVDEQAWKDVANRLKREANSTQLRKDLARNVRTALRPAVLATKAGIRSAPSTGRSKPSMRAAIARAVRPEVRLTGRTARVAVKVGTVKLRGFAKAGRRFNDASFRHPVPRQQRKDGSWTKPRWVTQVGAPGWFDEPMRTTGPATRKAVLAAMRAQIRRVE